MMSVVSLATSCALMKRLLAQRKLRSTRGLQDPELPIERTIVIVPPSLASWYRLALLEPITLLTTTLCTHPSQAYRTLLWHSVVRPITATW